MTSPPDYILNPSDPDPPCVIVDAEAGRQGVQEISESNCAIRSVEIERPYVINTYRLYIGDGDACLAQVFAVSAGENGRPWRTPFGQPFTGHSHAEVFAKANDWLASSALADLEQINKTGIVFA